jgi:hypothetical protein
MPLVQSCSMAAFERNIRTGMRERERKGWSKEQIVAIAFSTLKRACKVDDKKRMMPKEIVKMGKNKTESLISIKDLATEQSIAWW